MISYSVAPGTRVLHGQDEYEILSVRNSREILARNIVTKTVDRLPIAHLKAVPDTVEARPPLETYSEKDLAIAQQRLSIIQPLLDLSTRSRADVAAVADAAGVSLNTVYVWLRAYHQSGSAIGLVPQALGRKPGTLRIDKDVEAIIADTVDEFYLNKQQHSVRKTYDELCRRLRGTKLPIPHRNTVYNRIRALNHHKRLRTRSRAKEAQDRYTPRPGQYEAERPLQVVQIDHHKLDIILVDKELRRAIGRPWLTTAIDVYSRMIVGYYVSLDPPGALSAGLCLSNVILPKESFLLRLGVEREWPCWGLPYTVHLDNAKEFHGKMLETACLYYKIVIEYRPVMVPHFGAHIERFFRTLSSELKSVRGTTFSNIAERADYDSNAQAALTLEDLERWVAHYIIGVYHQTPHSALDMSPLQKFEEAYSGSGAGPAMPMPRRVVDEERLIFDFLPQAERKIEHYGIQFFHSHYWCDAMRPYVTDPGRERRKYAFRYDPRNMSQIYFLDPDTNAYVAAPYRNIGRPPISLWELREIKRQLKSEHIDKIDENAIFDTFEKMRHIESTAVKQTKKTRLATERRRHHKQQPPLRSVAEAGEPAFSDAETLDGFDDLEFE